MKVNSPTTAAAFALALLAISCATRRQIPSNTPGVFLLDGKQLQISRERVRAGDAPLLPPLAELERDATAALKLPPYSVMNKRTTPPSGDKHDYMSQAPYFWPDPKSSNGLPYIRRDGERNPEINKISDHGNILEMPEKVETLALAWYFTANEAYASKAAELIRAWFLDPATRMNPHFQFAQGIPGINTGRGIGLIESRALTRVVDADGLLVGSKSWTQEDHRALQEWFSQFLRWMLESQHGRDEAAAKNNHGTYYDMQVASFALFVGKTDLARSVLETAKQKRIAVQIEPDGRQPLELARTRAWSYSVGNLSGLMSLARLGENVGVDLWHYETADGRSIRKALDYLTPFALAEKKWAHQQLGGFAGDSLFPLLRRAEEKYSEEKYQRIVEALPPLGSSNRNHLLRHPKRPT